MKAFIITILALSTLAFDCDSVKFPKKWNSLSFQHKKEMINVYIKNYNILEYYSCNLNSFMENYFLSYDGVSVDLLDCYWFLSPSRPYGFPGERIEDEYIYNPIFKNKLLKTALTNEEIAANAYYFYLYFYHTIPEWEAKYIILSLDSVIKKECNYRYENMSTTDCMNAYFSHNSSSVIDRIGPLVINKDKLNQDEIENYTKLYRNNNNNKLSIIKLVKLRNFFLYSHIRNHVFVGEAVIKTLENKSIRMF